MWQFYSIIAWIVLIGVFSLPKEKNKIVMFACFGLFFILQALRHVSIGSDTHSYYNIFQYIVNGGNLLTTRYEIGYVYFTKFIATVFKDPQWLFIITSAFIIGGYSLFVYKNSKITWLSAFLFFTAGLFRFSISGIRQNMAIIFCLIGYSFIKKKKPIIYAAFVIVASLLHSSAILMLPIFFVPLIDYRVFKRWIIPIGVGSVVIFPILTRLFISILPQYGKFMTSIYNDGISIAAVMQFFISFTITAFSILFYNQEEGKDTDTELFLKMVMIKAILMALSLRLNAIDRIAEYFSPYEIVLLPNIIASDRITNNKKVVIPIVIIAFIVYSSVWYIGHPETQTVWPYKFFFQK